MSLIISKLSKIIFKKWKIWTVTTLLALICVYIYNNKAQPQYLISASFFLPSQNETSVSLFIRSSSSQIEGQIMSIAKSGKILTYIAKDVLETYPQLSSNFNNESQSEILDDVMNKKLKLKSNLLISQNEEKLFVIEYESPDPKLGLHVLQSYLKSIELLYTEIELGSQREVIKILDQPKASRFPIKPKKIINLLLGVIGGFGLGVVIILTSQISSNKNKSQVL